MISGPVTPDTARMSLRRGRKIPQTSQASIRSPPAVLSTPFPNNLVTTPCHSPEPDPRHPFSPFVGKPCDDLPDDFLSLAPT